MKCAPVDNGFRNRTFGNAIFAAAEREWRSRSYPVSFVLSRGEDRQSEGGHPRRIVSCNRACLCPRYFLERGGQPASNVEVELPLFPNRRLKSANTKKLCFPPDKTYEAPQVARTLKTIQHFLGTLGHVTESKPARALTRHSLFTSQMCRLPKHAFSCWLRAFR